MTPHLRSARQVAPWHPARLGAQCQILWLTPRLTQGVNNVALTQYTKRCVDWIEME